MVACFMKKTLSHGAVPVNMKVVLSMRNPSHGRPLGEPEARYAARRGLERMGSDRGLLRARCAGTRGCGRA
jgi:hypothetical protein